MPKVSIVVPIYGVEQYIERCARSLFEQTSDDLEYIFVNDCTPDSSIEVLNSLITDYPNRKGQIKILHHKENRGLPQARRTGILAATGDYIINFDSDDWVDKTIIEVLYCRAIQDCADIVICDIYVGDGINNRLMVGGKEHLSKTTLIEQMCQMKYPWSTCNKLVKRLMFDGVNFPICNNAEDMALMLQVISKVQRISYVSKPLYYYYSNPQSITRVLTKENVQKNINDRDCNNEIVFQILKDIFPQKKYDNYVEMFKWQVKKIAWDILKVDKCHYGFWKSLYSEINSSLFLNPYITLEDKLKCVLTFLRVYPHGN